MLPPDDPVEPPVVPIDPPPIEPPWLGEVVVPLLRRLERFEGTCDCCLFEWLVRGRMVSEEPEEPEDIDGDEPDMLLLPDDVCAKAVPATRRAAAAVTISVRIEDPFEWLVWALYERCSSNWFRPALFRV